MELKIKSKSSRISIERTDNGVILCYIGEDDTVISSAVYEIYHRDGILNFQNMSVFLYDIIENLKFPVMEEETNRLLSMYIEKIDPSKPSLGDDFTEEDYDTDEDKDE